MILVISMIQDFQCCFSNNSSRKIKSGFGLSTVHTHEIAGKWVGDKLQMR